jgi:hypothetical protein
MNSTTKYTGKSLALPQGVMVTSSILKFFTTKKPTHLHHLYTTFCVGLIFLPLTEFKDVAETDILFCL